MTETKPRVRRSLADLQGAWKKGDTKPLDDVMRAWKGVKALPPADPNSFFMIGGYHGEPFRGAGWGNGAWWGGYCNHGNVLFPTWHRVYLLRLEDALRSIPGCEDVALPYWDETSDDTLANGVPWALTDETYPLDGQTIPNPLRSFVFTKQITDNVNGDNPNYSKPSGYETVRYPLSGLVGTAQDRAATAAHNAQYPDYNTNVGLMNQNIKDWLTSHIVVNGQVIPTHVKDKYEACLKAPNYTVFSNTTSAQEWNQNHAADEQVTPLESPHNSIHLAVGGCDIPNYDRSPISGANGDMGENDTAGLDPIFFFHHCFVDRMFWLWQHRNGFTDHLDVIAEYPGTNSVDNQGPTPGVAGGVWLGLDSPLAPFKKADGSTYTSLDCINSETQLGVAYGPGSLEAFGAQHAAATHVKPAKLLAVSGINRAPIRGSFTVSAYATQGGRKLHLGTEAVLSRWSVQNCANCQTHLEVKAFFPVHPAVAALAADLHYEIEIRTRDGLLGDRTAPVAAEKRLFRLDVRDAG